MLTANQKYKEQILKTIDKLDGYAAKLEYLNNKFMQARTSAQEKILIDCMKQLNEWGK